MSIEAIYEDGVFKPIGSVDLKEHQIVQLQVVCAAGHEAAPTESIWERHGLGLLGGLAPTREDFKELGPEWDPYLP